MAAASPKSEAIPQSLHTLIRAGRCPHALLLEGGDDRSRKKSAEAVSMALLCENREAAPCGKCRACAKVKAGAHPDISLFQGTEKAKTVGISVIREGILSSLYVAPNEAQRKIYILHDADGMTREAQNAFLKTLEEPPAFVSFILTASGTQRLLSTVLSRCTTFNLGEQAQKEGAEREIAAALASALASGSEFALIQAAAPLQKNRQLVKKTAVFLQGILRDAAAADVNAPAISGCDREAVKLGGKLTMQQVADCMQVLRDIIGYADKNANENLLLSVLTARLADVVK